MRTKVGIALIAVAALVVGWFVLRKGPKDHMAALVAELRARGEPVTYAELRKPLPPDATNGAQAFTAADSWLEWRLERESVQVDEGHWAVHYTGPWDDEHEAPWYERTSPERMADLREFLGTLQPLYDRLDEAAAARVLSWDRDEAGDPVMGSFWWAWQRMRPILLAKLFSADAADRRLDTLHSLLVIPRHVEITGYVDATYLAYERRRGCASLRDAIESGRVDPAAARAALDALLTGPGLEAMPDVVRAGRVDSIVSFPRLLDGSLQREFSANLRSLDQAFNDRKPSAKERAAHVA